MALSKNLRRRKRLELIVPIALLIVSSVAVLYFFTRVGDAAAVGRMETPIPTGSVFYLIFKNDDCVGKLSSTFGTGKLYQWRLSGTIRIRELLPNKEPATADPTINEAQASVSMFFNPLQQMIQTSLNAQYQSFALRLTTANVHPIDLNLEVQSENFTFSRELRFPGPVVLEERSGGQGYGLQYHYAASLLPSGLQAEHLSLLDRFGLRLKEVGEGEVCEVAAAVDASAVRKELLQLIPFASSGGIQRILSDMGVPAERLSRRP